MASYRMKPDNNGGKQKMPSQPFQKAAVMTALLVTLIVLKPSMRPAEQNARSHGLIQCTGEGTYSWADHQLGTGQTRYGSNSKDFANYEPWWAKLKGRHTNHVVPTVQTVEAICLSRVVCAAAAECEFNACMLRITIGPRG